MNDPTMWPVKHTFVINLERQTQRHDHMKARLDAVGIPFTFVKAVDKNQIVQEMEHSGTFGDLLDPRVSITERNLNNCKRVNSCELDYGAVGCTCSHMHAHLEAIDAVSKDPLKEGPISILEDNVEIDADVVSETASMVHGLT